MKVQLACGGSLGLGFPLCRTEGVWSTQSLRQPELPTPWDRGGPCCLTCSSPHDVPVPNPSHLGRMPPPVTPRPERVLRISCQLSPFAEGEHTEARLGAPAKHSSPTISRTLGESKGGVRGGWDPCPLPQASRFPVTLQGPRHGVKPWFSNDSSVPGQKPRGCPAWCWS